MDEERDDDTRAMLAGLPAGTPCPEPFDYCTECCGMLCPGAHSEKCDWFGTKADQ